MALDRRLSALQVRIALVISTYFNGRHLDQGAWPAEETIAEMAGCSPRSVSTAVRAFEDLGYMKVFEDRKRSRAHNVYVLTKALGDRVRPEGQGDEDGCVQSTKLASSCEGKPVSAKQESSLNNNLNNEGDVDAAMEAANTVLLRAMRRRKDLGKPACKPKQTPEVLTWVRETLEAGYSVEQAEEALVILRTTFKSSVLDSCLSEVMGSQNADQPTGVQELAPPSFVDAFEQARDRHRDGALQGYDLAEWVHPAVSRLTTVLTPECLAWKQSSIPLAARRQAERDYRNICESWNADIKLRVERDGIQATLAWFCEQREVQEDRIATAAVLDEVFHIYEKHFSGSPDWESIGGAYQLAPSFDLRLERLRYLMEHYGADILQQSAT